MVIIDPHKLRPIAASPFFLGSPDAYQSWRNRKIGDQPRDVAELIVDIDSLDKIRPAEQRAIIENCRRANMAIYRCRDKTANPQMLRRFGQHFGLRRLDHHLCAEEDGISELTVAIVDDGVDNGVDDGARRKAGFIPYTNQRLGWHTDGYYNDDDHRIATILLHCVQPAVSGGENALLDPDIAYIRLRDENPDFITALMHPQCMTIPAHEADQDVVRPAQTGPVFGVTPSSGALYMRYTARARNIVWRDDPATHQALAFLGDLLASDDAAILRARLNAGEGTIFNNVLHNRTAFEDDPEHKRLVYRARYLDAIASNHTAKN